MVEDLTWPCLALGHWPTQRHNYGEGLAQLTQGGLSCSYQASASTKSRHHYWPLGMPFHSDSESFQFSAMVSLRNHETKTRKICLACYEMSSVCSKEYFPVGPTFVWLQQKWMWLNVAEGTRAGNTSRSMLVPDWTWWEMWWIMGFAF